MKRGLPRPILAWLATALLLSASAAHAAELNGRVTRIVDGDTLDIQSRDAIERVRLLDIDAPEVGQPFGIESRGTLRALCPINSVATVRWNKRDRDRRILGRVQCSNVDVNRELVRLGAAWVFTRYAPKNSPLYKVESSARASGIGLWFRPEPVPPWEWRRAKRLEGTI